MSSILDVLGKQAPTPTQTTTTPTQTATTPAQTATTPAQTTATPAQTTIGVTSVLSGSTNSGDGNTLVGIKVTLSQAATIHSLSYYVLQAAGNLRLGIYDATGSRGNPGALKAQTNSFATVAGWNTQNVIAPVSLPAGTYWLAYLPSDSNLTYPSGTAEQYVCQSFRFGSMPTKFPAIGDCSGILGWSFYGTFGVP
jgi:hypothetical protein